MAYTEKDLERFQQNELKPDDTLRFECAMCGKCCRKRQEPIMMAGPDIFRVAKALGVSPMETVSKYMEWHIGDTSHLPIVVLAERLDGSCKLLRNGRCIVQQDKPAVCALFPLGRFYDVRNQTYHYFMNDRICAAGKKDVPPKTLEEYLGGFKVRDTEEMYAEWHRLMGGIANVTFKMDKRKVSGAFLELLMLILYFAYDTGKPYVDQVAQNKMLAKELLWAGFHKKISFE